MFVFKSNKSFKEYHLSNKHIRPVFIVNQRNCSIECNIDNNECMKLKLGCCILNDNADHNDTNCKMMISSVNICCKGAVSCQKQTCTRFDSKINSNDVSVVYGDSIRNSQYII